MSQIYKIIVGSIITFSNPVPNHGKCSFNIFDPMLNMNNKICFINHYAYEMLINRDDMLMAKLKICDMIREKDTWYTGEFKTGSV